MPTRFFVLKIQAIKNGFPGPKSFRGFRETGPRFETGAYKVPEWELQCAFDLLAALEHFKNCAPKWIYINRVVDVEHILDHLLPSVYGVSPDEKNASPVLLKVCDPDSFVAEEIHQHADIWAKLSAAQVNSDEIVNWICSGVHPQLYY